MLQRSLKSETRYSTLFLPEDPGSGRTQRRSTAGSIVPLRSVAIRPTALRPIVRRQPREHQRLACPLPDPLPLLVGLLSVDLPHLLQPLLSHEAPESTLVTTNRRARTTMGSVLERHAEGQGPWPSGRRARELVPLRSARTLGAPMRVRYAASRIGSPGARRTSNGGAEKVPRKAGGSGGQTSHPLVLRYASDAVRRADEGREERSLRVEGLRPCASVPDTRAPGNAATGSPGSGCPRARPGRPSPVGFRRSFDRFPGRHRATDRS